MVGFTGGNAESLPPEEAEPPGAPLAPFPAPPKLALPVMPAPPAMALPAAPPVLSPAPPPVAPSVEPHAQRCAQAPRSGQPEACTESVDFSVPSTGTFAEAMFLLTEPTRRGLRTAGSFPQVPLGGPLDALDELDLTAAACGLVAVATTPPLTASEPSVAAVQEYTLPSRPEAADESAAAPQGQRRASGHLLGSTVATPSTTAEEAQAIWNRLKQVRKLAHRTAGGRGGLPSVRASRCGGCAGCLTKEDCGQCKK